MATLTFCGAAGTVTGSCSKITTNNSSFLIDCGLFQGNKTAVKLNYEPFPFEPTHQDFLILTHAHIDHSGLIPKLVNQDFNGPIYCTKVTAELLEYLLLDGAAIQQSNTERKNRKNARRGLPPVKPLYTTKDAEATLSLLVPVKYEEAFSPAPGIEVKFWNAGHIIGSASAEVIITDDSAADCPLRLLFSGDLGPDEKVFHPEPDAPEGYDYVICESTYGNRKRDDYTLEGRRAALEAELVEGLARGGNVVIPAFAVERSQELLHDIGVMLEEGKLKGATVYLDSPLAKKVTGVFLKYANTLDDMGVAPENLFKHKNFRLIQSVEDSKKLNQVPSGAIIISASGMCDAGRIQHHLKANMWREDCTILLVGYQSPGTVGSLIQKGLEEIRIHGKNFKLRAAVRRLGNYSAHADQEELISWILERGPVMGGLFLNHGEDQSRETLRAELAEKGLDPEKIICPGFDESFELTASCAISRGATPQTRSQKPIPAFDYHNQYAALNIAINNKLESDVSDAEKAELLKALQSVIDQQK